MWEKKLFELWGEKVKKDLRENIKRKRDKVKYCRKNDDLQRNWDNKILYKIAWVGKRKEKQRCLSTKSKREGKL